MLDFYQDPYPLLLVKHTSADTLARVVLSSEYPPRQQHDFAWTEFIRLLSHLASTAKGG